LYDTARYEQLLKKKRRTLTSFSKNHCLAWAACDDVARPVSELIVDLHTL
jgi:hypothetical protein